MTRPFRIMEDIDVAGKRVLVRVDLNVPTHHGRITDATRIRRIVPTLQYLRDQGAIVIILSHFRRPDGEFKPAFSLAPLVDTIEEHVGSRVQFAVDCIGKHAEEAVAGLQSGDILLLENLRFHPGEEANDPAFTKALAAYGDIYINDAFSCSQRSHSSIVGLPALLPSAAGRLMQAELEALHDILDNAATPVAAVVGGSKVSTKLALLESLLDRTDRLIIGGGMANTFLAAQGHSVGRSLVEEDLIPTAQMILRKSEQVACNILLPEDVVVAPSLSPQAPCIIVPVDKVPDDYMILDIGPRTAAHLSDSLAECKTVVWNGPVGAFETSPFDVGTVSLARTVAGLTYAGKVKSIAGGGDTVSALSHAGLGNAFTYLSTAGGAFLEWLEGKDMPGIAALAV